VEAALIGLNDFLSPSLTPRSFDLPTSVGEKSEDFISFEESVGDRSRAHGAIPSAKRDGGK
jgi:hypothetical protein